MATRRAHAEPRSDVHPAARRRRTPPQRSGAADNTDHSTYRQLRKLIDDGRRRPCRSVRAAAGRRIRRSPALGWSRPGRRGSPARPLVHHVEVLAHIGPSPSGQLSPPRTHVVDARICQSGRMLALDRSPRREEVPVGSTGSREPRVRMPAWRLVGDRPRSGRVSEVRGDDRELATTVE